MADQTDTTQDTDAGSTTTDAQTQGNDQQQAPQTFEEMLAALPEDFRAAHEQHTKGLKSALATERETRKAVEKQLREAAAAAEEGSDAKTRLEGMAADLDRATRRAEFAEAAHAAGVADVRLAWLAVEADETLLTRTGAVDFEALKQAHPAVFATAGAPRPSGMDAGSGLRNTAAPEPSMTDYILTAAGRRGS